MQGYVEMTGVDSDTSQDIAEAISLKGGRWDQNQFLYLKSDQLIGSCSTSVTFLFLTFYRLFLSSGL